MAWWNLRKSGPKATESEEVIRLLLRDYDEGGADWLWQTDNSRRLINPTHRFAKILGKQESEIEGVPLLQLLSGEAWETGKFPKSLYDFAEQMKRQEPFSNLIVPCSIGDVNRWFELSGAPRLDADGNFLGFRGVGSDVTVQRKAAEQIAMQARQDAVTNLPNLRHLTESLAGSLSRVSETGDEINVVALGCTNLGDVKLRVGYRNSEHVLKVIADRLRSEVGRGRLVGTTAPDEFIAVFTETAGDNDLEEFIAGIVDRISAPVVIEDGREVRLEFASGRARANIDENDSEALIRRALDALYGQGVSSDKVAHSPRGGHTTLHTEVTKSKPKADLTSVVLEYGPAARSGVESLLIDHERRLHNGPPEALDQASLDALKQLHLELGELINLASQAKPLEKKLGLVAMLSKRVFKFSKETGEIFVAGLKPLLASVPVAFGTMYLLQAVCGRELFEALGAGAAIAIVGGYFSVSGNKR